MRKILTLILIAVSCILISYSLFALKEYGFQYTKIIVDDMASEEDIKKLVQKIDLRKKEMEEKIKILREEEKRIFQSSGYKRIDFQQAGFDELLKKRAGQVLYNYIAKQYEIDEIKHWAGDDFETRYNLNAEYSDVDEDGTDEIIGKVFIDDFFDNKKGGSHIFILKKINGKWKDISFMNSYGEIYIYNKKINNCRSIGYYNGFKDFRNRNLTIGEFKVEKICEKNKN